MSLSTCPNCDIKLKKRNCKIVCSNCGVLADCSDPFYL